MSKEVIGKIKSKAIEVGKKIGERKKEILISAAIIGIVGTSAGCGETKVYTDHVDIYGAQTPSEAAGTPTPTETLEQAFQRGVKAEQDEQERIKAAVEEALRNRPKETVTVPGPERTITVPGPTVYVDRPVEVYPAPGYDVYTPRPESGYGDFYSVRFNQNTGRYDLIDTRNNQPVNIADHMVQPIANLLTGVGNTKQIPYHLHPGEAAVEQGNSVNGEYNGVFQIRVNRTENKIWFNPTIRDGAITIVPIASVAAHEADALNRAVDNNWARNNVRGER